MRYIVLAISMGLACAGCKPADSGKVQTTTDDDKTFYALGAVVGGNLSSFNLTPAELEQVKAGLADAASHKTLAVSVETYMPKIQALQTARLAAAGDSERKAGEAYLNKAASEPGASKTASGLIYTTITEGTGPSPQATDTVKVHYQGTLINGKVFDSSIARNAPISFPLNGVIPCWTEGVQLMKVGGKSRFVCPSDIAYGDRGAPPDIKPGATLVFEVQLLGIEK
jgi:FKBP-type peptidyl-prolyl cis-trans isomerase FkpA